MKTNLKQKKLAKNVFKTFCELLNEKGVKGVHLGVGGDNEGGIAFYRKYGFKMIHDFGKTGKVFAIRPSDAVKERNLL